MFSVIFFILRLKKSVSQDKASNSNYNYHNILLLKLMVKKTTEEIKESTSFVKIPQSADYKKKANLRVPVLCTPTRVKIRKK